MKKKKIGFKQIIGQLKEDLIGKDSYRGVTFTYSWLANQFGHYSLGYIPTLIAWAIIVKYSSWSHPALWSAVIVSILWLLFELYNFLGPLLLKQQSEGNHLFVPSKEKYTFQPDWKNVAFDTFTDLLFFWFGAFSASIFLERSPALIIILVVLFIAFLYPAYYWYVTKIYLQYTKFPFQCRLSQWKRPSNESRLPENEVKTVLTFLKSCENYNGNHLLVLGGRRSGKSTLSVGIGTELSIKRSASSYYTAIKLLNLFSLSEPEIIDADECKVWSWRSASLLIIDDINPGSPTPNEYISAREVWDAIHTGDAKENIACLKNKNMVWVLGDVDATDAGSWHKLLMDDIGVGEEMIRSIGLGFTK